MKTKFSFIAMVFALLAVSSCSYFDTGASPDVSSNPGDTVNLMNSGQTHGGGISDIQWRSPDAFRDISRNMSTDSVQVFSLDEELYQPRNTAQPEALPIQNLKNSGDLQVITLTPPAAGVGYNDERVEVFPLNGGM